MQIYIASGERIRAFIGVNKEYFKTLVNDSTTVIYCPVCKLDVPEANEGILNRIKDAHTEGDDQSGGSTVKPYTFKESEGWVRNLKDRIEREQDNQSNDEVDSLSDEGEIHSQNDAEVES